MQIIKVKCYTCNDKLHEVCGSVWLENTHLSNIKKNYTIS